MSADRSTPQRTTQDLLAAVTFVGIAAGLYRAAVNADSYGISLSPGWLVVIVMLVPAAIGAAYGSLAHGWRRSWRLARLAVATGIGFYLVWALLRSVQ